MVVNFNSINHDQFILLLPRHEETFQIIPGTNRSILLQIVSARKWTRLITIGNVRTFETCHFLHYSVTCRPLCNDMKLHWKIEPVTKFLSVICRPLCNSIKQVLMLQPLSVPAVQSHFLGSIAYWFWVVEYTFLNISHIRQTRRFAKVLNLLLFLYTCIDMLL